MNRLNTVMRKLHEDHGKALALFLTAGYPSTDFTVPFVLDCERAGADVIEIGMPFSDPIADGPVIQHCSRVALRNGVTLASILRMVSVIRNTSSIPLVLMGYMNPILRYGVEEFFRDAARAGIDGIILPEIPLEEAWRVRSALENAGLSFINLVTPTTPPERILLIDSGSTGFLYCVSTTGVTGGKSSRPPADYLAGVKRVASRNPVLVGFGISGPDDVRRYAPFVDGVIVGSALLSRFGREPVSETIKWVRSLKAALRPSPDFAGPV